MTFRIEGTHAVCLTCGERCDNRAAAKVKHRCPTPEWLAKARARARGEGDETR